jgi:hypothetical protein
LELQLLVIGLSGKHGAQHIDGLARIGCRQFGGAEPQGGLREQAVHRAFAALDFGIVPGLRRKLLDRMLGAAENAAHGGGAHAFNVFQSLRNIHNHGIDGGFRRAEIAFGKAALGDGDAALAVGPCGKSERKDETRRQAAAEHVAAARRRAPARGDEALRRLGRRRAVRRA